MPARTPKKPCTPSLWLCTSKSIFAWSVPRCIAGGCPGAEGFPPPATPANRAASAASVAIAGFIPRSTPPATWASNASAFHDVIVIPPAIVTALPSFRLLSRLNFAALALGMAMRRRARRPHSEHQIIDAGGVGYLIATLDPGSGAAEQQVRSPLLKLSAEVDFLRLRRAFPEPAHPAVLGSILRPCVGPSALPVAGAALATEREPFVEGAADHPSTSSRSLSAPGARTTVTIEPTSRSPPASGGRIAASSSEPSTS